ncbi:peptide chain release factor N(5)-glutamine methyltransferase [Mucilaginibacter sp. AW1-3]
MKTIADALLILNDSLKKIYAEDELTSIKYLVLSDISNLSKAQLRAFTDQTLTDEQWQKLTEITAALQTGIPVQYVLGHTEFYGLPFNVNPSVLIPRPETEELVEWILEESQELRIRNQDDFRILDIGTGSGCIPISLKKNLPNAQVSGLDISAEALSTAKQNAKLNNVDVDFINADILNVSQISNLTPQISIIVSNPPYVTEREKGEMHSNVLDYEPHTALFVPDNDALVFYNAIADFALMHLKPGGLLFFEINENLGKQTVDLLKYKSFKNIELRQDMRGKDRMIKAVI